MRQNLSLPGQWKDTQLRSVFWPSEFKFFPKDPKLLGYSDFVLFFKVNSHWDLITEKFRSAFNIVHTLSICPPDKSIYIFYRDKVRNSRKNITSDQTWLLNRAMGNGTTTSSLLCFSNFRKTEMGQLVEKLFDMLFTQSRCARNQGLEMFWCFLIEISIFSQQKWVNWLKNCGFPIFPLIF